MFNAQNLNKNIDSTKLDKMDNLLSKLKIDYLT